MLHKLTILHPRFYILYTTQLCSWLNTNNGDVRREGLQKVNFLAVYLILSSTLSHPTNLPFFASIFYTEIRHCQNKIRWWRKVWWVAESDLPCSTLSHLIFFTPKADAAKIFCNAQEKITLIYQNLKVDKYYFTVTRKNLILLSRR